MKGRLGFLVDKHPLDGVEVMAAVAEASSRYDLRRLLQLDWGEVVHYIG